MPACSKFYEPETLRPSPSPQHFGASTYSALALGSKTLLPVFVWSVLAFRNLDECVGVGRVIGAASTAYIDGLSVAGSWAVRTLLPWAKGKGGEELSRSSHFNKRS